MLGVRGTALRATLLPIDLFINVILSLPAAFVLIKLRPARVSLYVLWAALPSSVWLNRMLIGNMCFGQFFGQFALGWLPAIFALPVASWLLWLKGTPRARSWLAIGSVNSQFRRRAMRHSTPSALLHTIKE